MSTKSVYKVLLNGKRLKPATTSRSSLQFTHLSDVGRILPSPAFRRMQAKAQVFSLEDNAGVRTRLTHSLEVASYGRIISEYVTNHLCKAGKIDVSEAFAFSTTVENACLLHDIGNPPFGHFAESAIQDWFVQKKESFKTELNDWEQVKGYYSDFESFDGNAQGFRIATKLSWVSEKFGLNLTCALLAAYLKYPWTEASEPTDGKPKTKVGVFKTEKKELGKVLKDQEIPANKKSPLNYIMECADDIAYCMSDIEDGIEKKIIRLSDLESFFRGSLSDEARLTLQGLGKVKKDELIERLSSVPSSLKDKSEFVSFKIKLVNALIEYAKDKYIEHAEEIETFKFEPNSLFEDKRAPLVEVLKSLKKFARTKLFVSPHAVDLEICSAKVVKGLLDAYEDIMLLSVDEFQILDPESSESHAGFGLNKRLYSLLPSRQLQVYKWETESNPEIPERIHRMHLILDFISGMTDQYALKIFQIISGVSAEIRP